MSAAGAAGPPEISERLRDTGGRAQRSAGTFEAEFLDAGFEGGVLPIAAPETCVPTGTVTTALGVPVAETVDRRSPRVTGMVEKRGWTRPPVDNFRSTTLAS